MIASLTKRMLSGRGEISNQRHTISVESLVTVSCVCVCVDIDFGNQDGGRKTVTIDVEEKKQL